MFNSSDNKQYGYNMWLIKIVLFYEPQKHCVICDSVKQWNNIPKDKSLFYTKDNIGVACGNILIMWLSLFYLDGLDKFITNTLGYQYYGRYMDDFYLISQDKSKLLDDIKKIDNELSKIGARLHPEKTYIQEVKKGINFVGCVIKPHRRYLSNKTVKLIWQGVKRLEWALKSERRHNKELIDHCICVINSYLGLMKDKNTYKLRKKIIHCESLSQLWKYCEYDRNYEKIGWKKMLN